MKKLIPLFLLVVLVAFTAPALAGDGDVQFFAFKTITLTETFTYTENVAFTGTGNFIFDGEAWAKIQEQQELYSNVVNNQNFNDILTSSASITGSYNDGAGIANVNQAPGNLNNQANEVALSLGNNGVLVEPIVVPEFFQGMFCEAQVVSVQYNGILYTPGSATSPIDTREPAGNIYNTGGYDLSNTIDDSFAGFAGVVNVNQSAGSLNNQGNAVAIAGGIDQIVVKAATNVMLAQNSAYNTYTEGLGDLAGNNTTDSINASFAGATGVFNVNQSSGSLNNQKNVVAISFQGPLPNAAP